MIQISQIHPVVTLFLFVMLVAGYIDWKRVRKENHEWYRLFIIGKVNASTFEGMAILKAIQDGESSQTILNQLKQVNEDNSLALARMYGVWYKDLQCLLKGA